MYTSTLLKSFIWNYMVLCRNGMGGTQLSSPSSSWILDPFIFYSPEKYECMRQCYKIILWYNFISCYKISFYNFFIHLTIGKKLIKKLIKSVKAKISSNFKTLLVNGYAFAPSLPFIVKTRIFTKTGSITFWR